MVSFSPDQRYVSTNKVAKLFGLPVMTLSRAAGECNLRAGSSARGSKRRLDFAQALTLVASVQLRRLANFDVDISKLYPSVYKKIVAHGDEIVDRVFRIDHSAGSIVLLEAKEVYEKPQGATTVLGRAFSEAYSVMPVRPIFDGLKGFFEEIDHAGPAADSDERKTVALP